MSGTKGFDKLLEKATSPLLLEVDWECILSMCDLVRQGDVQAKYAVTQIRKKMNVENLNSILFSLQCLESIVKNCGSKVHQEIATRDFMDALKAIALAKPDPIKAKILELIQCWAHAFRKNPNYKIVEDYFNSMKLEGFQFSALKESEAMFDVEEAPAWKEDSECTSCFRCRAEFTTLKRRHHCRACGQIFCHACSSKTAAIPKFGIEKEVRVCDLCFEKLKTNPAAIVNPSAPAGEQLPVEYLNSALYKEAKAQAANVNKKPAEKSEQEFEEELQLALALSQSEAEAAEKEKKKKSSSTASNTSSSSNKLYNDLSKLKSESKANGAETKQSSKSKSISFSEQQSTNGASAPYLDNVVTSKSISQLASNTVGTYNEEEIRINKEIDEFVEELKKILELYINRMKSDSMRGRSITNDTAVQSLFLQLQQLHPKLMSYIKYQEDARGYYENLQDKLTQLKDAREALNALRHENYEKKKRENEERERLRQMQIAQKLQYMRQQKQSYYQYQNELNLQRLHLQERDLQMRLEQQRQLVMKRDQQFSSGPFPSILPNDSYNPGIMNANAPMPGGYPGAQMPLMNNMPPVNPAALNNGTGMYPPYLDSAFTQLNQPLPSMVPNGNMLNSQVQLNPQSQQTLPQAPPPQQQQQTVASALVPPQQVIQPVPQAPTQVLPQNMNQIQSPPQQQQQPFPAYLNQQQVPLAPPQPQQTPVQYQQNPIAQLPYSNSQQQLLYNQQAQFSQQPGLPYQYQQPGSMTNIQTEAKENAIKEAQLISFD